MRLIITSILALSATAAYFHKMNFEELREEYGSAGSLLFNVFIIFAIITASMLAGGLY